MILSGYTYCIDELDKILECIMQSPLLHTADVGISVFTSVDVAKEAADIILLNNFLYHLSR